MSEKEKVRLFVLELESRSKILLMEGSLCNYISEGTI
jgi:hypothetical protein